jgi:hypothetical protein
VVATGIALLGGLLIGIATIRVSRQELAGSVPAPQEPASQPAAQRPGTAQRHEDRVALAAAARPSGSASRRVIHLGEQHRDDSGVLAHMEVPAELRDTTR